MKKSLILAGILILGTIPVYATVTEEPVQPDQAITNKKGFATINYDRQDSEQVGVQRIVNDHSAFNINILIVKKGKLFNGKQTATEPPVTVLETIEE